MGIEKLIDGYQNFKSNAFESNKSLFNTLATNHAPEVFFITCCDARISPELITSTKPGDLFVYRSVGNIVPKYSGNSNSIMCSMLAAIEFATLVLKVNDIIICGHSDCRACAGFYQDLKTKHLFGVDSWLEQSRDDIDTFIKTELDEGSPEGREERTEKMSLICQYNNLINYPSVKSSINNGSLGVHAWYYNIGKGGIEMFDNKSMKFTAIA